MAARRREPARLTRALVALFLVAGAACTRSGSKPKPASGEPHGLVDLRLSWELPGLTVPHSLLANQRPQGSILLALRRSASRAVDLCAVEMRSGQTKWCSPLAHHADVALSVAGDLAVAHDSEGYVAAYELATGKPAWTKELICAIGPGDIESVDAKLALAKCSPLGSTSRSAARVLGFDTQTGAAAWAYPPTSSEDTTGSASALATMEGPERARPGSDRPSQRPLFAGSEGSLIRGPGGDWFDPTAERRSCVTRPISGCIPIPAAQLSYAFREGRVFLNDCDVLREVNPASGATLGTWPIAGSAPAHEAPVMAIDVAGHRLTIVTGSLSDTETGRVVTFDGNVERLVARAPAIDPGLVALGDGVLVVRSAVRSSRFFASDLDQSPVLRGYAVTEAANVDPGPGDNEQRRVRDLLKSSGRATPPRALEQIPRWQEHLTRLMHDREPDIQDAAIRTAATRDTPPLRAALLAWLEPLPANRDRSWPHGADDEWWYDLGEQRASMRVRAAERLVETEYLPALKALGKMAQETPIPGLEHMHGGSSHFVHELCGWVLHSPLPEARAVIADHDRAMDAEGAFAALCSNMPN